MPDKFWHIYIQVLISKIGNSMNIWFWYTFVCIISVFNKKFTFIEAAKIVNRYMQFLIINLYHLVKFRTYFCFYKLIKVFEYVQTVVYIVDRTITCTSIIISSNVSILNFRKYNTISYLLLWNIVLTEYFTHSTSPYGKIFAIQVNIQSKQQPWFDHNLKKWLFGKN